MSRLKRTLEARGARLRIAFWGGIAVATLVLIYLARHRPSWPWFSLWLFALIGGLGILSVPRVRAALNLSWFGVTLLTLTGVAFFDLYLFHVETHRQRSERLEVHGVYFDPDHQPIRVGVGYPGLDVRLEGSFYEFDRWSLALRRLDASRYAVEALDQVDMVRLPHEVWWRPWGRFSTPALGARLSGRQATLSDTVPSLGSFDIELLREGRHGTLLWNGSRAPLSLEDRLLDRRLSGRLSQGIPLSDLDWDSLPDRELAEDLVLTRTGRGRSVGRLQLSLPVYRLVSRRSGEALGLSDTPVVAEGDTLRVTSRGKTWAFALDRVPGVSRVAAPIAVRFVRRPRPTGWALPSGEACGDDADRCAVLSTRRLPPPQPHFDLSGFGLDTTRYSVLARLETDRAGVRLVGAQTTARFAYGEIHPLPALAASDEYHPTGVLVRVHRAAQGQQSAVILTVFALFMLIVGALVTLSGDARIWEKRKTPSPHMTAAWGFLNVFMIFLGVRLALGLRVAYSPPFYDRAAATAVGLWVTFAFMLVALGRWSAWAPRFWRLVRRAERPVSRLFLPGVNGTKSAVGPGAPGAGRDHSEPTVEARARRRGRFRTAVGLVLLTGSTGLLLWQRPDAAASLLVASTGLGAWLAMGITRRRGIATSLDRYPLSVITEEEGGESPSLSFAMAAGASVVLAMAIHAPWMALAPVLVLLFLFGVNHLLGRWAWIAPPGRRGWVLFVIALLIVELGILALFGFTRLGTGILLASGASLALILGRPVRGEGETGNLLTWYFQNFMALGRAIFSGVGWVGVLLVLGALVFLSSQQIPPFVRFALVFMLFLLAIRAGLACHRVLETGERRGQFEALGLLVIPLGVLLVFMLFDFGLGLVFFVPMFITVLLSARIDRLPGILVLGSVAVIAVISIGAWSVLWPSLADLRGANDLPTFSAEYREVGNRISDVLRTAGMSGPVTRASIRSIAASDPELLEEALAFAGPSEALFAAAPSREQVWGGRAYAASEMTGTGFAGTTVLGRGIPTAVSYAENTYSVYILSEHGALGGIGVLLAYMSLLVVVGIWIFRTHRTIQETRLGLAVLAMTVGGVLWLVLPAVYVAASNLAMVPLTGQNMPFLGLNSWADVVLVSGLATGIVFGLAALDVAATEGRSA